MDGMNEHWTAIIMKATETTESNIQRMRKKNKIKIIWHLIECVYWLVGWLVDCVVNSLTHTKEYHENQNCVLIFVNARREAT